MYGVDVSIDILIHAHIVERVTIRGYEQEFLLSTCLTNSAEMQWYIAGSNIASCSVQSADHGAPSWMASDGVVPMLQIRGLTGRRPQEGCGQCAEEGQSIMIAHHSRRTQASAPHQNQCKSTLT